jgi:hypothetical protein
MRPRLALNHPWWTPEHGRLLWGSRGHRDSSKREREVRSLGFSPIVPHEGGAAEKTTQRRSNRGSWWCSDGEIVDGVRRRVWSCGGCSG